MKVDGLDGAFDVEWSPEKNDGPLATLAIY
jgi:hypothetical protein